MKKIALTIIVLLAASGMAFATPYTFTETFLGDPLDTDYYAMAEVDNTANGQGHRARFQFDLTGTGGNGVLIDENGVVAGSKVTPTLDETGYNTVDYAAPYAAFLEFYIIDNDGGGFNREQLVVDVKLEAGGKERVLNTKLQLNQNNSVAKFEIDLGFEGLLDELIDGQLMTFAIAPKFGDRDNDFLLGSVSLTAFATDPVPEPGTIALLGFGMFGLFALRKRIQK